MTGSGGGKQPPMQMLPVLYQGIKFHFLGGNKKTPQHSGRKQMQHRSINTSINSESLDSCYTNRQTQKKKSAQTKKLYSVGESYHKPAWLPQSLLTGIGFPTLMICFGLKTLGVY